eukprot:CAMPEP_0117420642 /NCGR_PEP_ID=MMETSP0758-20121206/1929_1 /TAXON_ID=63605 /ORGANISM="Percolomonas cosmopolitus, Strain AE-1 (ATCC 50343)" /LENGTH=420 /DNA_ID=CAMNT_0005202361 /DNA_START=425 /DNA_END=1687 /DNA_ORIENTATION=+
MKNMKKTNKIVSEMNQKGLIDDVEDIEDMLQGYKSEIYNNSPLIVTIPITMANDATQFLSDDVVKIAIKHIEEKVMEQGKNYLIRIQGRDIPAIEKINERVHFILSLSKESILIQLTLDMMNQLASLPNSILLNPRVHPVIEVYLQKEKETPVMMALQHAFSKLRTIADLQVMVVLIMDPSSLPDLTNIMMLLRQEHALCRYIMFNVERSPLKVANQLKKMIGQPTSETVNDKEEQAVVDILPILKHIQKCTHHDIQVNDFMPASAGAVLTPFFKLLDSGDYPMMCSPLCAYATILVNTKRFSSTPISRLFDMDTLYHKLVPIIARFEQTSKLSMWSYLQLKYILKKAIRPNVHIPDVLSYINSKHPKKQAVTAKTLGNMQFFVIHTKMDVACVDIERRAYCSFCEMTNRGLKSSCLKCV